MTVKPNNPYLQEAVLKTLQLSNKPLRNITIQCKVIEAKDKNGKNVISLFRGQLNSAKDCELRLARSGLDHESMETYFIKMMINTLSAFVNPNKKVSEVTVHVQVAVFKTESFNIG